MDWKIKLIAASSVLLAGMFLAMFFRHERRGADPPGRELGERLVLRQALEPQRPHEPVSAGHDPRSADARPAPSDDRPKPTVVRPLEVAEAPPELGRDFPGHLAPPKPPAGRINGQRANGRTHKIVDGDILGSLAERYLGSAERSAELYEANRDRLLGPEVLPIGVELRIPAAKAGKGAGADVESPPSPTNLMPRRTLVPVRAP